MAAGGIGCVRAADYRADGRKEEVPTSKSKEPKKCVQNWKNSGRYLGT